jgi:hypothetical protein
MAVMAAVAISREMWRKWRLVAVLFQYQGVSDEIVNT